MRIINELKNKYEVQDIETAFVIFHVSTNSIAVKNNLLVKAIIRNESQRTIEIRETISRHFEKTSLFDLVRIFELLIPEDDKKINGAFFTPYLVTSFISDETVTSGDLNICDPSCGCGAFLIEAANKINLDFGKSIVDIIQNNLYGIDIADYSVRRAKILLTLLALGKNEDVEQIVFNIKQNDSLEANWNELFPEILKRGGFDVVIGNPPYVKFQDLPDTLRKSLYENWITLKKGSYNLYFAFFELGIKILNDEGILGYITPNNYFTSLAGIHLREFLACNKYLYKVIDFNHIKVFDAQTYTCVTFLNKAQSECFLYERIDDVKLLDHLGELVYSTISFSTLNNSKWRLLRSVDQGKIEKIENTGIRLGDLVDIRVGIATLKDSVYFVDGTTYKDGYYRKDYKGDAYLVEASITKPIAKISDFKRQEHLDRNKRRIIFPYRKVGGKVELIPREEFRHRYPRCYEYLLAAKGELAARDKGKLAYREWYAYGRTQGLNFWGQKLLTPTFSEKPRFLYEKNPEALFCNGYGIFLKEKEDLFSIRGLDLDSISKILNSKVMEYYIGNTSVAIEGGYPCYQKNFIELLGIPYFTDQEIQFLREETDKEEIDEFLMKKYQIRI